MKKKFPKSTVLTPSSKMDRIFTAFLAAFVLILTEVRSWRVNLPNATMYFHMRSNPLQVAPPPGHVGSPHHFVSENYHPRHHQNPPPFDMPPYHHQSMMVNFFQPLEKDKFPFLSSPQPHFVRPFESQGYHLAIPVSGSNHFMNSKEWMNKDLGKNHFRPNHYKHGPFGLEEVNLRTPTDPVVHHNPGVRSHFPLSITPKDVVAFGSGPTPQHFESNKNLMPPISMHRLKKVHDEKQPIIMNERPVRPERPMIPPMSSSSFVHFHSPISLKEKLPVVKDSQEKARVREHVPMDKKQNNRGSGSFFTEKTHNNRENAPSTAFSKNNNNENGPSIVVSRYNNRENGAAVAVNKNNNRENGHSVAVSRNNNREIVPSAAVSRNNNPENSNAAVSRNNNHENGPSTTVSTNNNRESRPFASRNNNRESGPVTDKKNSNHRSSHFTVSKNNNNRENNPSLPASNKNNRGSDFLTTNKNNNPGSDPISADKNYNNHESGIFVTAKIPNTHGNNPSVVDEKPNISTGTFITGKNPSIQTNNPLISKDMKRPEVERPKNLHLPTLVQGSPHIGSRQHQAAQMHFVPEDGTSFEAGKDRHFKSPFAPETEETFGLGKDKAIRISVIPEAEATYESEKNSAVFHDSKPFFQNVQEATADKKKKQISTSSDNVDKKVAFWNFPMFRHYEQSRPVVKEQMNTESVHTSAKVSTAYTLGSSSNETSKKTETISLIPDKIKINIDPYNFKETVQEKKLPLPKQTPLDTFKVSTQVSKDTEVVDTQRKPKVSDKFEVAEESKPSSSRTDSYPGRSQPSSKHSIDQTKDPNVPTTASKVQWQLSNPGSKPEMAFNKKLHSTTNEYVTQRHVMSSEMTTVRPESNTSAANVRISTESDVSIIDSLLPTEYHKLLDGDKEFGKRNTTIQSNAENKETIPIRQENASLENHKNIPGDPTISESYKIEEYSTEEQHPAHNYNADISTETAILQNTENQTSDTLVENLVTKIQETFSENVTEDPAVNHNFNWVSQTTPTEKDFLARDWSKLLPILQEQAIQSTVYGKARDLSETSQRTTQQIIPKVSDDFKETTTNIPMTTEELQTTEAVLSTESEVLTTVLSTTNTVSTMPPNRRNNGRKKYSKFTPRTTTTSTEMSAPTTTVSPELVMVDSLRSMKSTMQEVMTKAVRHIMPFVVTMGSEIHMSSDCTFAFLRWIRGVKMFEQWAIKMIDASSKIPEGVLYGTFSTFGSYDECVAISVPGSGSRPVRGQYCSVNIRPLLPPSVRHFTIKNAFDSYPVLKKALKDMNIDESAMAYYYILKHRIGLCLPSSCSIGDLEGVADMLASQMKINVTVDRCETSEDGALKGGQIATIVGILFAISLVILGTIADIVPRLRKSRPLHDIDSEEILKDKSTLKQVSQAFSAYTNARRILSTAIPANHFEVVHGIKFLSLTWVMLGHVYYCKDYMTLAGLTKVRDLGSNFAFQVVLNSAFAADTFFFLSGLLVVYTVLQSLEKRNAKFNLLGFYAKRFCRLTPVFLMASGLLYLGTLNGSGPIWHETLDPFVKGCENYWWTNLLYVSNLVPTAKTCVPHGWYVSCDMQFYLISPLIFLALHRRPKLGLMFLVCGIVVSMATVGILTFLLDLPPVSLFSIPDPKDLREFLDIVGYKPYTHFAPYCIGMATGYFLVSQQKLSLRRIYLLLGWCTAIAGSITVVYGTLRWNSGQLPDWPATVAYASTCRSVWALGVAWVTIVCIAGQGGIVNTLLSWKGFIPLSRLTYIAYLLHPLLMYLYASYIRSPFYFSQYVVVYLYLGHVCVTFGLSFFLSLAFEAPFINLEKIVSRNMEKRRRRRRASFSHHHGNNGHQHPEHPEIKDAVVLMRRRSDMIYT